MNHVLDVQIESVSDSDATKAIAMLVFLPLSQTDREKLLALIVKNGNEYVAYWTLQDVQNIGHFRAKLLEKIVSSHNSIVAWKTLHRVADLGHFRPQLKQLAAIH